MAIQTAPEGRYFGDAFSGYDTFVTTWKDRRLVLWAGASGLQHPLDVRWLGGQQLREAAAAQRAA